MATYKDIAARLEAAGLDNSSIDYERGVAVVFFRGLLTEETPSQTEERQRRELKEQYHWTRYELGSKDTARKYVRARKSDPDCCVVCGAYAPEGYQVCPSCREAEERGKDG
jgi:hypothetical protein